MTSSQKQALERQGSSQSALDLLAQDSLKAICAAPGPFVTIFLPARHPGAAELPRTQGLKTILRDGAQELQRRQFQGPIDQLLKPLEELAKNPASLAGGSDSVIFVGPGLFRHFGLPAPISERLVVASHPHITPLLAHLMPQQDFYVLAIGKKLLRLGRWHNSQCTEVPLPAGVPKSFEETLVFEQPDHDLQSRSAGGPSGQVGTTRFGVGAERDQVHDRLHHYFQIVDRALTGFLKDRPIVLVGIAQELAAYRSMSKYPHLLTAEPTSPEHLTWAELEEHGRQAVLEAQRGEAERALGEFRETARRDHVISGIREVLEAAREGRVHKLIVENNAEHEGLLGPSFPVDSARLEGDQDLINAATVETIRGHGEVHVLNQGEIGVSSPIAAVLRYSG
jgi:Bacterial archaeo-eukaryotic release factor family 6